MDKWYEKFENKKIVILGYGLEGQSTHNFLKRFLKNCDIQIMDKNSDHVKRQLGVNREQLYIYPEALYLKMDETVDYIFKSPGIPLKQLEGKLDLNKITSQSNEFIGAYKEQIIGVTGTKGKSTVCSFLQQLLKEEGVKSLLVGNIGKPAFDYIEKKRFDGLYIYELSSHQLETTKASPKYSVILNIFEEHLDHYHSYNHYAEAKMNIARYQGVKDYIIYSELTDEIVNRMKQFKGIRIPLTESVVKTGILYLKDKLELVGVGEKLKLDFKIPRYLVGKHNLVNISIGIMISKILKCDTANIRNQVIRDFKGLPHRLAFVETVNGVSFYNDSIATIPQATIMAIKSISNVETVIIGGMDRGIDYQILIDFMNGHKELKLMLLPDSGHKIYEHLEDKDRLYKVKDMEEAVNIAKAITTKGKTCILSPAAASYGFYKDFKERGHIFEGLVRLGIDKETDK